MLDINLKHFKLVADILDFSESSMSGARATRSRDNDHAPVDQTINHFVIDNRRTAGSRPYLRNTRRDERDIACAYRI